MREPTPEELASAKATAKEITGSDALELVPFPDLEADGFCLLVRKLTPAEFGAYLDASLRNEQDARDGLFVDAVVWPSRREATELLGRYGGISTGVATVVEQLAGLTDESAKRVTKLTSATPAAILERAGLPKQTADDLLLRFHRPGQLTLFEIPILDVAFVFKTPGPLYATAIAAITEAKAKGVGFRGACITAVSGITVWGKHPLEDDCAKWPALPGGVLIGTFSRLGGSGAAGARKSL